MNVEGPKSLNLFEYKFTLNQLNFKITTAHLKKFTSQVVEFAKFELGQGKGSTPY